MLNNRDNVASLVDIMAAGFLAPLDLAYLDSTLYPYKGVLYPGFLKGT